MTLLKSQESSENDIQGTIKCVTMLLENKADPNVKNKKGETPIKLANKIGNKILIELLKKFGAKGGLFR